MGFIHHQKPLLFAHRGGAALYPENTLYAFRRAVKDCRADAIELDIHVSKDGEPMVIHDTTVDRTTDGSGMVRNMMLNELKGLDAGYRFSSDGGSTFPYRGHGITIPTLKEVLEAYRGTETGINIDIKRPYPYVELKVYNLVTGMGMLDQVLVNSSHPSGMGRFHQINMQGVYTGADAWECFKAFASLRLGVSRWYIPKDDAMQVPERYRGLQVLCKDMVKLCRTHGIKLHVWTIDDPDIMDRLLHLGVDGIMTDRPDLLLETYKRFGYK